MIISIPIIFLISLFILKRIRKSLSSDLDKGFLGIILDKFFGIIYGVVFSYFILATLIFFLNKFNYYELNFWIINNSEIMNIVNNINEKYIYIHFTFNNIIN